MFAAHRTQSATSGRVSPSQTARCRSLSGREFALPVHVAGLLAPAARAYLPLFPFRILSARLAETASIFYFEIFVKINSSLQ